MPHYAHIPSPSPNTEPVVRGIPMTDAMAYAAEIPRELEGLAQNIAEAIEVAETFIGRVSPILTPEQERPGRNGAAEACNTEVGSRLSQMRLKVEYLTQALIDARNRVAL